MNSKLIIILEHYSRMAFTITKFSVAFFIMSFMVYSKPVTETVDPASSEQCERQSVNSVSMSNGRCAIDDATSKDDRNKQALLLAIYDEELVRRKNKTEIPSFIIAFFDSLSAGQKFDLANPGEPWRIGDIMNFAVTKVYDPEKKETVNIVSPGRNDLPGQQLVYFGIGKHMALFSYYTGGLRITQHVAMIKFEDSKVIDFWSGSYLDLSFTTQPEILNCIGKKKRISKNDNC
ncbi:MAG: hypothetical protein K0S26_1935 [Bacteroidota bacterium]|jgi:hypothetical protein|nr:hypothetical protein [Bacteroidota bacterium]